MNRKTLAFETSTCKMIRDGHEQKSSQITERTPRQREWMVRHTIDVQHTLLGPHVIQLSTKGSYKAELVADLEKS